MISSFKILIKKQHTDYYYIETEKDRRIVGSVPFSFQAFLAAGAWSINIPWFV